MRSLIALLILGNIATSASAKGGTEMHEIANEHAFRQSTEQWCLLALPKERAS
jgi:hypothetical protein